MKARLAVGLVVGGLVLALVPGRIRRGEPSDSNGRVAGEVSQGRSEAAAPIVPPDHSAAAMPEDQVLEKSLVATVEAETDACRASEAIERAAASVPDAQLGAVLNGLLVRRYPACAQLCQVLVRRWAETDLSAAAVWAERLSGDRFQGEALRQVAIAWADNDIAAAANWVKGLPDEFDKAAALLSVAYEACRTEPLVAIELMNGAGAGPERDRVLVHALSQWAETDAASAWTWASRVPESAFRDQLLAAVAVASAQHDGAGAAGLIAESLPPGPEQERAAVAIAQRWAEQSPRDAASWAARFPEPVRAAAVQNVVTLWSDQDSEAAAAWLREVPTSGEGGNEGVR